MPEFTSPFKVLDVIRRHHFSVSLFNLYIFSILGLNTRKTSSIKPMKRSRKMFLNITLEPTNDSFIYRAIPVQESSIIPNI